MTFIGPKNKELASKLLDAARVVDAPASSVKSVLNGFEVPQEVADAFDEMEKPPAPKKTTTTKSKATAKSSADDKKE